MSVTESWKDQAACAGYNLNIFFSRNKVDQEFAVGLCKSCPVRQDCFDNADAEDFQNCVRAGFKPGEFKGGPARPPLFPRKTVEKVKDKDRNRDISVKSYQLKNTDWSHKLGKFCPQGHEFTKENMDAYGRCRTCGRARSDARRARIKG